VIAEGFAKRAQKLLGMKVMVTYSGSKGMHTYVVMEPGTSAADARAAASLVIDSFGFIVPDKGKNFFKHAEKFPDISIEVFPKQDDVGSGFGNLVRLPLGVNRKTGGKGFFMDLSVPQDKFKMDDPMLALTLGSLR
jgi:hypothetical protein